MKNFHRYNLSLLIHLHQQKEGTGGYSLVITLASIILLGTLLVTAALISKVDSASTNASTKSNSGFYAAEAGLSLKASDVRSTFEGLNLPSGTEPSKWEDCVDDDPDNDGDGDFACASNVTINDQQIVTFVNDVTEDDAISIEIPDGVFKGLNALEYRYDLMSVALNTEGNQQSPTSILGMRFKSRLVPLFQFAAFFDQDLDLFAPPTMTLNGRVHSNNNLYLNSGLSTLNISGVVSTAGTLFHGEKWSDLCYPTVNIATGEPNSIGGAIPYSPLTGCTSGGSRQSYTQADVNGTWPDRIFIESEKLKLPEIDNYQMPPDDVIGDADSVEENYTYWDKADLRLVLELSGTGDNPSQIKLVNTDGTIDVEATATLNSCSAASTTLTNNVGLTATRLRVASSSGFRVGDAIQMGSDFDSNVIRAIPNSTTIDIRRQAGHSYQSTNAANTGATVKKPVVWTSDTFYNYREKNGATGNTAGRFIRMLNVDVKQLLNCIDANVGANGIMGTKELSEDSDGGMVWFMAVDGANSHVNVADGDSPNNYGIRVYNGEELASSNSNAENVKGLTIVTDQAMYIQGNYNSSGVKRPASFITDSLNVLSSVWTLNDERGYRYNNTTNLQDTPTYISPRINGNQSLREAEDTTINAAFFGGIDVTGGGNTISTQDGGFGTLGGGLNNYPRMHEEWSSSFNCPTTTSSRGSCRLRILGSLVSFGPANRVNGPFCGSHHNGCNIYHPPTREWSYDTSFNQAQNLPPLTPRAVYLTQEIFERDFTYTSSTPNDFSLASIFSPKQARTTEPNQPKPFLTAFSL